MKNKFIFITLLFSFIYSANTSNNRIIAKDKRNQGILTNSGDKVISIKDYKKALDMDRMSRFYQSKGVNATKLENMGKVKTRSIKDAWKPKIENKKSLTSFRSENSYSFLNKLKEQRTHQAPNSQVHDENSRQNRNVVSGTITTIDGGTLPDSMFVYFYDGSFEDTTEFWSYYVTMANTDGTYEMSVPEGEYYVTMYSSEYYSYFDFYLESGSFTVVGDESQTLNMDLYPTSEYAALFFYENFYWNFEHLGDELYPVNIYDLNTDELVSSLHTGLLGFQQTNVLPGDYRLEIVLQDVNNEEYIVSGEYSVEAGEYAGLNYSFPSYISGSIFNEEGRAVDSAYVIVENYDTSYYELADQEGNFFFEVEQGEYFVYGAVEGNNNMSYWPATYDEGVIYATDSSVVLELTLYDTVSYGFVTYSTEMDSMDSVFHPIQVDFYDLQSNENIYTGQTGIFGFNGVSLVAGEYGVQFEGEEMDALVVQEGQFYNVYSGSEIDDEDSLHNVFGMLYEPETGEGLYGFVYFYDGFENIYSVSTDSLGYFSVSLPEGHWSSWAEEDDGNHFISIWAGGVFLVEAGMNEFYLEHALYPNDYFGFAMVSLSDSTGGLSNQYVEIIGADVYTANTDHYGNVCSGLIPGEYTVFSTGFQSADFMLEAGMEQFIELMPLNSNVTGHIMTVEGQPVANAFVLFQNFDDAYFAASADSNGYYEALIPPGVYSAYAQLDSTHWVELANGVLFLDEGMEQSQDFTLYPVSEYGFLVGVILGDELDVAMRPVHIADDMGEIIAELHSNLYGEVAISLLPGNYMMLFDTPFGVQEHFVSIEAGMMNYLELMDEPQFPAAHILDIHDVPEDQGGRVYVVFEQSQYDTDGAMDSMRTEMYTIERMDGDHWVGLTSVGAYNAGVHTVEVSTLADSTSDSDALSTYRVLAHMNEGNFISEPAEGYSLDNIAPDMVVGLNGDITDGMVMLSWNNSTANDISHYNVYYGTESDFLPSEENIVSSHSETMFNHDISISGDHFYVVSAIDIHDNHGDLSEVLSITLLDVDAEAGMPSAYAIHQNYPNPFNPTTQINYDLPDDALVSINVYDLMGRSIRTLVNAKISAGYNSIFWDATNDYGESVSAGMYIYTIQTGEFKQTKKMLLLK